MIRATFEYLTPRVDTIEVDSPANLSIEELQIIFEQQYPEAIDIEFLEMSEYE